MPAADLLPDWNRNFPRFAFEPDKDTELARNIRIFSGQSDSSVSWPGYITLSVEVNAHNRLHS